MTNTMKKEITNTRYRRIGSRSLPMLLLALFFLSCQDEYQYRVQEGRDIRFAVTNGSDWNKLKSNGNPSGEFGQPDSALGVLPIQTSDGGEELYLHTSASERGVTTESQLRSATQRHISDANFYDSFGVFASVYSGSWSEDACKADYMYNIKVTKESSWTTKYSWPGGNQKIKFFAYAPYQENTSNGGSSLQLSAKSQSGSPTLTYTVDSDITQQKDLLVAASEEKSGDGSEAVPMTFKHALTTIKFVTGDNVLAGNIHKVTLSNVFKKGTLKIGTSEWTAQGEKTSFSMTKEQAIDGSKGQEITEEAYWFMMIPQTLSEDAKIEVEYTDNLSKTKRTLTASLANQKWEMGKTITYRISTSSIQVVPIFMIFPPNDVTYEGGETKYKVTSYATLARVGDETKTVPVAWKAEFVEGFDDTGYVTLNSKPEWFKEFTQNDTGSSEAKEYTAKIDKQEETRINPHDETLKKATPVSDVYDLCTKGGTTQTNSANCYIINKPGKYKFHLYYGNAMKDGKDNKEAYTTQSSAAAKPKKKKKKQKKQQSEILETFLNHMGKPISKPAIYENGVTIKSAEILWQDAENLVTGVSLSEDKHEIQFEVKQETIKQGNAVIAVRDDQDQIAWSWHIWVTDYEPGQESKVEEKFDFMVKPSDKDVTNASNKKYTFMGVTLGWCFEDIIKYKPRTVKVRYTQEGTNARPIIITYTQTENTIFKGGNNPYYQHGRKDPMIAGVLDSSNQTIQKTAYSKENASFTLNKENRKVSIEDAIKNPNIFYYNGMDNWCSKVYYNLWSMKNTKDTKDDSPVVKTIYDPSPVGYCLPSKGCFTGVGGKDKPNSPYKVTDILEHFGWEFYCKKMNSSEYDKSGGIIFYPASGAIEHNSGTYCFVKEMGRFWTCTSNNGKRGASLKFSHQTNNSSQDDLKSQFGSPISSGCSVIPMKENNSKK